jgi:hypothetical protein
MIQSDDLTKFISNIPWFENLCCRELETLSAYLDRQFLKSGEMLFNQWDKKHGF